MNFHNIPIWQRDITTVKANEILKFCNIDIGQLDILDGSPPCQGFSTVGKRKGAFISMSRGGNPWDNAVMEAFIKSLKSEVIDKKHLFETRDLARKEVFEYIEMFFNPIRLHSALGYKSPIQFET